MDPTIPSHRPRYELTYRRDGTTYAMVVENQEGVSRGVRRVTFDGSELASAEIPLVDDGRQHSVRVHLEPANTAKD